MNIIQPNFLRIQYKNYHNSRQIDNAAKIDVRTDKPTLSRPTADNIKANFLVNFKGGMKSETSDSSGIGKLNHQTAFFREPETDEIVQNYILENFGNDEEINVVSGACSTGEEAKSYAMMLDSIKDKLNISGFDISAKIIEDAKSEDCQLIRAQNDPFNFHVSVDLDSENMLLDDDISDLSEYRRKCRDKFEQYYTPKGDEYRIPVFPQAKQQLKDFEAALSDPEEFERQKKQFDNQFKMIKKENPDFAEFIGLIGFEESIKISRKALERQVEAYKTVRDFSTDMRRFENCSFVQGDVMNLDKLYKPNSVNTLLYRNALYHTLCIGDSTYRFMKESANNVMDAIAKQMNKVVKPQGLVVFGEDEWSQGIDVDIVNEAMRNNGFEPLCEGGADNIWVKVKDIEN